MAPYRFLLVFVGLPLLLAAGWRGRGVVLAVALAIPVTVLLVGCDAPYRCEDTDVMRLVVLVPFVFAISIAGMLGRCVFEHARALGVRRLTNDGSDT